VEWLCTHIPSLGALTDTPQKRAWLKAYVQTMLMEHLAGGESETLAERLQPLMARRPEMTVGEALEILRLGGGRAP